MSSSQSVRLDLPYLMPAQAQKHVTHNEALRRLDAVVQLSVKDVDIQSPPTSPVAGDCYALGSDPTGDWGGHSNEIAVWVDDAWLFFVPAAGWRLVDLSQMRLMLWTGAGWTQIGGPLDNVDGVGVGTSHDTVNRLAVQSEASLFSGIDGGHQVKVNKTSDSDTASLMFQSGWTGHAEIGLAGDTDLSLKTSADGIGWITAIKVDAASGTLSGNAIMTDAQDASEGRLMPVGAFGLGETDAAAVLADLDDVLTPAGAYRVTAATQNRPSGPDEGVVTLFRQDGQNFVQRLTFADGNSVQRYCNQGVFTRWARDMTTETILGTVSQTNGVPTGAVMETGSNTHGSYLRFADGTQICTNGGDGITIAPAPFVGGIAKVGNDVLWVGRWY